MEVLLIFSFNMEVLFFFSVCILIFARSILNYITQIKEFVNFESEMALSLFKRQEVDGPHRSHEKCFLGINTRANVQVA